MVETYKDGTNAKHRQVLRAIGMGKVPRASFLKLKNGRMKAQPQFFDIDYPRAAKGFIRSSWDVLEVLTARGFCKQLGERWELTDKGRALMYQRKKGSGAQNFDGIAKGVSSNVDQARFMELINIKRAEGWPDPVDAMNAIAYDTRKCDDCGGKGERVPEGEVRFDTCDACEGKGTVWKYDVNIRLVALNSVASYTKPKMQAIAVKTSAEKTHAEWLKELDEKTIEGDSHEVLGIAHGSDGMSEQSGPADDPG